LFNEWQQTESEIAKHGAFVVLATRELHKAGYKVAGFSFSTGNPEPEVWRFLKNTGFAGVDAIALHEYWAKQGFSTWNALRYRRVHDWLGGNHPPFVITECGRDAIAGEGGEGKPGWKLQGVSREDYAKELVSFSYQLEQDPYVIGAVVYTFGPWVDFAGFDSEEIALLMPAASGAITIPTPQGGGTMSTYHLGNIDITDLRSKLPVHPMLRYAHRELRAIKRIVIHHSANPASTTAEAMARYHIDHYGWPGIGYHFVVTAGGEIQYVNDHTLITNGVSYENADTVHICLPGDFTSVQPPPAQLKATQLLIDNYRLAMGQMYPVVGHKDIAHADDPTSCPGATWVHWRDALVSVAKQTQPVEDWKAKYDEAKTRIAILESVLRSVKSTVQNYV
jgi:hypothetical protein